MRKLCQALLLCWLVSISLTSCGFHLAGSTPLLPQLHVLYIKARSPYDRFNQILRRTLKAKGAIIVEHPDEAPITLAILTKTLQVRNMGVQSNNFYANQIFTLTVVYQLQDPSGYPITQPHTVISESTPQIHKTQIQGVETDEVLKNSLRHDVVQRMLDQLDSPLTLNLINKFQHASKKIAHSKTKKITKTRKKARTRTKTTTSKTSVKP